MKHGITSLFRKDSFMLLKFIIKKKKITLTHSELGEIPK